MPESIFIQIGQCGNQIGTRFWEMALHEHAQSADTSREQSLNTLFHYSEDDSLLRARAVLIDMEESVVNDVTRVSAHRHATLFDTRSQCVTGVSGSGNNYAHGRYGHLTESYERICDAIRRQVELCDCLQSFHLCHSMGGGTGSGLGSGLLPLLEEQGWCDKGAVSKICSVVYPAANANDVVTSPYNSVLAMKTLNEYADCVLPVDNQALIDLVHKTSSSSRSKHKSSTGISDGPNSAKRSNAFDQMNNIVAQSILHLTSSMRFSGPLNMDLNELTSNMVPFPDLKYLITSMAPLSVSSDISSRPSTVGNNSHRTIDSVFDAAMRHETQLMSGVDPRSGVYLTCALLVRSPTIGMTDIRRNISRMKETMRFVKWNQDGWKTSLCSVPSLNRPVLSVMSICNHSAIRYPFTSLRQRFNKLYKRRAHVHHYTDYMDIGELELARQSLDKVIQKYTTVERQADSAAGGVDMKKMIERMDAIRI